MNRRRVLSALAGLGLTGGSAWLFRSDFVGDDGLPLRIETVDARGSSAGGALVPAPDEPTVVDLFATWCPPCSRQMRVLGDVYPEYSDRVTFVSVTTERVGNTLTRDDLREWWRTHDGNWTLGLDPDDELTSAMGAEGIPYVALTDASGRIRWDHLGVAGAETLRTRLDRVLGDA